MEKEKMEKEWYDDPDIITTLLIGCLILLLIISQGYAIRHQLSLGTIMRTLLNNNITYVIYLVYLIVLKTKRGKKSFTGLNFFMACLYFIIVVGSFLNMTSAFNLEAIVSFASSFLLLSYFTYSFLEHTNLYKSLSFDKIPFSKISNDWYFGSFAFLQCILFVLGIMNVAQFDRVVLLLLDTIFNIGFVRYIYLYQNYKEKKLCRVKESELDEKMVLVAKNDDNHENKLNQDQEIKDIIPETVKKVKTSTKKSDTTTKAPVKKTSVKKTSTSEKKIKEGSVHNV
ncbi:MAG: hypothetical protein RSE91_03160 [Bacilli bacterium]